MMAAAGAHGTEEPRLRRPRRRRGAPPARGAKVRRRRPAPRSRAPGAAGAGRPV